MWEKDFGIFMTLNIYIFKEILLNLKFQKLQTVEKIPNYFCHVLVVMFQWYAKFLPFERDKKEKLKKVKRM
jgi:hypothetical protein